MQKYVTLTNSFKRNQLFQFEPFQLFRRNLSFHLDARKKLRKMKGAFADYYQEPISPEEAVNNILYEAPEFKKPNISRHLLNCLVLNEPGVLSRISNVLASRNFNIDSLVVAKTEVPDLSRMTITLKGPDNTIEQARRQLEDIIQVWAVLDFTHTRIIERELLLVKVSTVSKEQIEELSLSNFNDDNSKKSSRLSPLVSSSIQRQALIELANLFKGNVVDMTTDCLIIELSAKSDKIDAFIKLVKPFGIIEATRSGAMVISRGQFEETDEIKNDNEVKRQEVDASILPPG